MNEDRRNKQFTRRNFLVSTAAVVAYGLLCSNPARASVIAKGARIGGSIDKTRFVLDLSAEPEYKVFTISDPSRIVIDLKNTSFEGLVKNLPKVSGIISSIRLGGDDPNTARIVLDLNAPAAIEKAFILSPQGGFGWRLVIDAVKTDVGTFIALSGEDKASIKGQDLPIKTKDYAPKQKVERKKPVIILDPGHGGKDPGAIGVSGVFEKDITLAMGLELKEKLEKSGRYKVVMTRRKDETLSLRKRVEIARQAQGDLFISLHADSIGRKNVRGLSVYTLSETASDNEAAALAVRENKADIIAGIDLDNELPEVASFLIDLTRRETMNLSAEFAAMMVDEMIKSFDILRNTHRFAGFAVLKAPDIPSVLFEMGYLSNPNEEKLLRQNNYRSKLAISTVNSVHQFFSSSKRASLF